MEAAGEWSSSFNGVCSEESDFMAQLLGTSSLPNAAFWGGNNGSNFKDGGEERSVSPSDEETNGSMFSFSLGNNSSSICYPFVNTSMDFSMMDGKSNGVEGYDFLNQEASNDSAESDKLTQPLQEDKNSNPCEISKKRPRVFGESQRSKKLKKCVKVDENENENEDDGATNVVLHRQSSTCCSEDESNASHEANGVNSSLSSKRSGAQNSKGKARASRGSATDPQSLYARKRRERINERLKILQHLVPNGTKVDISTMLEEAVEYVKFLQVQIKLLSSDDMWMYAPIAYNGMDLRLDFKIPFPKPQS